MIAEKTIKICGKDVRMRYCAATETGFETIAGHPATVFVPTFGKNEAGEVVVTEPAKATTQDYLYLAMSAVIAAYARSEEEAPISSEDILYEASPSEVSEMLATVVMLRNDWYKVPDVVQPEMEESDEVPNP